MEHRRRPDNQQQQNPSSIYSPSTKTHRLQEEEDEWWKSVEDEEEEDEEGSMATKAIRASSGAQRHSSLSSAYAAPHPLHPKPQPPASRFQSQSQNRTPASNNRSSSWIQDTIHSSTSGKSNSSDSNTKPSFCSTITRKAKSIIDDEGDATPRSQSLNPPFSGVPSQSQKPKSATGTEEGLTIVENCTADIIQETRKLNVRKKFGTSGVNEQDDNDENTSRKSQMLSSVQPQMQSDLEIQLKASRDVSMAMAAKTKVLLRELKTVKADLAFAKERCAQLEEENKLVRESLHKGDNLEDDDLTRLQLESLLAEKARLAHENSVYARENRFLRDSRVSPADHAGRGILGLEE